MVNKTLDERKKIYDLWHKEVYQTDTQESAKRAKRLHNEIIKHLEIHPSTKGSLLDIACGKGLFLSALEKYNNNLVLYGNDISQYALDQARKIVHATFNAADGEHLPYQDNFFDFCTCIGGLEYYQDTLKGVKEIARVLKRNGIAVIFVPNLMFLGYIWLTFRNGFMPTHGGTYNNKTYYDYNDERFYTYKGWADILKNGGLQIISSSSFNFIGRNAFINPFLLKIFNLFFSKFIPFNLSYSFIIVCKKNK